jgi:hypothetical protein
MESTLYVILLTLLRLLIPGAVLLAVGEAIHRREERKA